MRFSTIFPLFLAVKSRSHISMMRGGLIQNKKPTNAGVARFLHMKKESAYKRTLYYPNTENQKKYVKCLENNKNHLLVVTGPAGTGKTLFACITAINFLKSGTIDKIILTRPVVPVEEEEIGFLPGDIKKKMDPWTRPIFDILLEHFSQREIDSLIHQKSIEICPLAYMRGRTFKRSIIIADEMQNSSPNQMKMITTRIGRDSKMIITGDIGQSDLYKMNVNGLSDIVNRINNTISKDFEMIKLIELNYTDIERSEVVVKVLELYDDNYISHYNNSDHKNYINNTITENHLTNESSIILVSKKETKGRALKKPGYMYKIKDDDAALIPIEDERLVKKYWWDYP